MSIQPQDHPAVRDGIVWSERELQWINEALAIERGKVEAAADIIQLLLDVQNGCPLPSYQDDFDRVNRDARSFLRTLEQPK